MQNEIRLESLQRLAAGREAEVFAVDDARVLRLGLSSQQRAAVECEALVLAAAWAPVPALHGKIDLDGRPGLIIERLGGGDLLTRLDRRPWSVWSVARTLGRLHAQLHAVDGPERLPQLRDRLGARLQSPLVPSDVRDRGLSRLDELATASPSSTGATLRAAIQPPTSHAPGFCSQPAHCPIAPRRSRERSPASAAASYSRATSAPTSAKPHPRQSHSPHGYPS
jgi:hypothetical protein